MKKNNDKRYELAKKVTLIGAFINLTLSFLKIIGGFLFNSHGLLADGLHSLVDFFTDLMVLFASKFGSKAADDNHPYGHQKIETAATLFLSFFFIIAGIGIVFDASYELRNIQSNTPSFPAAIIAFLSIISNEALFWYTFKISRTIKSKLIEANAWHHRADVWSSVLVFLGLIGALLGYTRLDAYAAIIVSVFIIKIGFEYGVNSIKELVDTGIAQEDLQNITDAILEIPGVNKVHQLRSRRMGNDIFIDVHILVDPKISVSEGHYIAQKVHYSLMDHNDNILDVIVHVDPEDDEIVCPSVNLPDKKILERKFFNPWKKIDPNLYKWYVHYLNGSLEFELFFKTKPSEIIEKQIAEDQKQSHNIKNITIYYEL